MSSKSIAPPIQDQAALHTAGEPDVNRESGTSIVSTRKRYSTDDNAFLRSPWLNRLLPFGLPLLLLIGWQLLTANGWIAGNILPTPVEVFRALIRLLGTGELVENIAVSTSRALSGFAIGGGLGFLLGVVNGISQLWEKISDSSIQMIRNIPHLSLIPLVIVWFGIGEEAKLFLVSLGVFFPVYLNTFHGIRSVDRGLVEMGKVYGLSRLALYTHIILPGALPSILVGIRYALGIMWLTLIVAETVAADAGIGYMAMNAREFMQMDVIVLSILLYALLGKLSDSMAKLLEKRWLRWNPVLSRK
ncbi:aliphatic sulfonate ABC transporter permease SsuC [Paenibacillus shenyangensis]|uniref:aliphatic sulfonate ABC transporter permease SsuC n=1 Tax=Paenibacillus sp. A9 TaxID=1284352 RepID=UPI00035F4163|nr:aliphatic sulfonate ABC transporter permease SsuC [Paenibacillus sp. A9]